MKDGSSSLCGCSRLPGTALRVFFGLWLSYVGLMKWAGGVGAFAGYIRAAFEKTWIPAPLLSFTGYLIPVAELALGVWLVTGCCARLGWLLTALLMFLLTFGQTVIQAPTVADNWFYVALSLVGVATSGCCSKAASETQGGCGCGGPGSGTSR